MGFVLHDGCDSHLKLVTIQFIGILIESILLSSQFAAEVIGHHWAEVITSPSGRYLNAVQTTCLVYLQMTKKRQNLSEKGSKFHPIAQCRVFKTSFQLNFYHSNSSGKSKNIKTTTLTVKFQTVSCNCQIFQHCCLLSRQTFHIAFFNNSWTDLFKYWYFYEYKINTANC